MNRPEKKKIKPLNYPGKIIVAWAEAIGGNTKIRDFLLQSEYKELGVFVYALYLKDDAREWLMNNGFPHLMALINGAEGDEKALNWLDQYDFKVLKNMALAGDAEREGYQWLMKNGYKDLAFVASKIQSVKDDIEEDHNDFHKRSKS